MAYQASIEQGDTGMVIAAVWDTDSGKRVGLNFFHWPPFSQKRRLQRAEAWAAKWIENCRAHCRPRPTDSKKGP